MKKKTNRIRVRLQVAQLVRLFEFTDDDWEALAGAENFKPSGNKPLIGEARNNRTVVADKNGIQVFGDPDAENDVWWTLPLETLNETAIMAIALSLPYDLTDKVLEEYGFTS